jgi:2-haloacid dehalogenase
MGLGQGPARHPLGPRRRRPASAADHSDIEATGAVSALGSARLGLSRDTIGFVSSNGWDVAGAKASGFQVAWVNRQGALPEELGMTPDLEGLDLKELAQALGR